MDRCVLLWIFSGIVDVTIIAWVLSGSAYRQLAS